MALDRELAFFHQHEDELIRDHPGKFVLIRGDRVIGAYWTAVQAYAAGVRRFGDEAFLVKQV
jgi:hypothetical protein